MIRHKRHLLPSQLNTEPGRNRKQQRLRRRRPPRRKRRTALCHAAQVWPTMGARVHRFPLGTTMVAHHTKHFDALMWLSLSYTSSLCHQYDLLATTETSEQTMRSKFTATNVPLDWKWMKVGFMGNISLNRWFKEMDFAVTAALTQEPVIQENAELPPVPPSTVAGSGTSPRESPSDIPLRFLDNSRKQMLNLYIYAAPFLSRLWRSGAHPRQSRAPAPACLEELPGDFAGSSCEGGYFCTTNWLVGQLAI